MEINWQNVRKVLIVRLRSIGDTVLTTPSLIALRRFLPDTQIDILLEDWVAPLLDGFGEVDNILTVSKAASARAKLVREIRKTKYDIVFNLHGGTTATFFVRTSGAKHRVGYKTYQYSFLYNHRLSSASDFWQKEKTHSAEQQMALFGFLGVPVEETLKTHLAVTKKASVSLKRKLIAEMQKQGVFADEKGKEYLKKFALIHPAAAFESKQWATEKFARIAEFLSEKGLHPIAVAAKNERSILDDIENLSNVQILTFDDLTLPEITALASRAKVFVGNDSGIAHIASAVKTPSVVIFGSSNRDHWRPWTDAPNKIVYEKFKCQPCAGYTCEEFGEPKCILNVKPESVIHEINDII